MNPSPLYPNTPEAIKNALFASIIRDFKTPADKGLNDFLLDVLNECEKVFGERNKIV